MVMSRVLLTLLLQSNVVKILKINTMSVCKRSKNDPLLRNNDLNRSIRAKGRKKRMHDQMHVGLQERLEKEMKIRDGAARLIAACTHEGQLLEAAKTLHTSNARTLAYMGQLQKLKAAEVMEAVMDDPGFNDNSKVCGGRVAISDIRIPLVWKEAFTSVKTKDTCRHAVFCVVTVGSEVQDTELVSVDKNTTDIAFSDVIVFENASYDFKMNVEVYVCPMSSSSVSAPTPQKLISRLNRSVGRNEGKRIRENMKENVVNGIKNLTPCYEKIASSVLTLGHISDTVRSHDLYRTNQDHQSLPLYESITCRLVAQPKCITDISVSGFLHMLHMMGSIPNWSYLWCEVRAGLINGWKNPEGANQPPDVVIDLIAKDVKVNEIEKSRQRRTHSFQVRDLTDRHIFAAKDANDAIKWIRGLRQHKSDHGAWGGACLKEPGKRSPMFIASPSPKKVPSDLLFERGVRKTLIYEQLGMDSPLKAVTEAVRCTDLLRSEHVVAPDIHPVLLENQTTAPWASFFTGNTKPAKVTRTTNIQRNNSSDAILDKHSYNLRSTNPNRGPERSPKHSCSDNTSLSDDAFSGPNIHSQTPNSSKNEGKKKKKRRAPKSPWEETSSVTPPVQSPLPKLPPKLNQRKKNLSPGSSLDEDEGTRSRDDKKEHGVVCSQRSNQSSGYKPENESSVGMKQSERVWANEKNCVIPVGSLKHRQYFERSKSLDCDGFQSKNLSVAAPSNGYTESSCRTNSLPRSPTSPRYPTRQMRSSAAPRRSYITAVESSKVDMNNCDEVNHDHMTSYRRLHYDTNAKVYCQAKPPPLPPKLKKASSFPTDKQDEPVYAEIDRSKKREEPRKGVDAYTRAHHAIISVCKQRMEEEEKKKRS